MGFVKILEAGKDTPWHIRPYAIEAVTDYGAYRVVQVGHRHIHSKQTLEEIFKAIKEAEAYPAATAPSTGFVDFQGGGWEPYICSAVDDYELGSPEAIRTTVDEF